MFFQTLSLWLLFLLYLVPLLLVGIIILRKTTTIDRFEILIPTGSVFGISIFTFLINIFSFITPGKIAVIGGYLFLILVGIFVYKLNSKSTNLSFASGKALLFYLTSILAWASFIFWKASTALIGSDTNLYYSIAHSIIRGNFPPQTPWQSDLPLSYHLGASELLGAFHFFTNLSFEFLHIFFACLFIFLSSQIIIWIWKRHESFLSFVVGNLIAGVVFISFGFFKLAIPVFPIKIPEISNLHQLFLWIRDLPTVNQSIEVYGAPINLDALIYFIFHTFGLAIFLSIVTILIYYKKNNSLVTWAILSVSLSTLALVSESIFVAAAPAVFVGVLLIEKAEGTLFKNLRPLILLGVLASLIILFQGGIITSAISPSQIKEESVIVFPDKEDIKEDFTSYHYYQEISKILPVKDEWLSLRWFHVGVDLLILINILILIKLKLKFKQFVLLLTLYISGFTSLIAYHALVPKFLVANGNRFLSFSFLIFSLVICLALIQIVNYFKKTTLLKRILLTVLILWVFIPTIVPPLALLSKTRFGENKLIPKTEQATSAIDWIKDNLPFNSRVVVLDAATPHPSGHSRAMVQAGVFAPIFTSEYRAYTIEASPEYLDIAYFLSPKALQELKIDTLLVDSNYYEKIDSLAKDYLKDERFFKIIYEKENSDQTWEKVFKIKQEYLSVEKDEGTLGQLATTPLWGKIYIDNEENFNPPFLRRALIFSLRDKDLYYLPQSGVYLNIETNINQKYPDKDLKYDYLVLGKNTNPKYICNCKADIVWKGLNNQAVLWRSE